MKEMNLGMHPSVKMVAEFMHRNVPVDDLRAVAKALAAIAPSLWSDAPDGTIAPMRLVEPPLGLSGVGND